MSTQRQPPTIMATHPKNPHLTEAVLELAAELLDRHLTTQNRAGRKKAAPADPKIAALQGLLDQIGRQMDGLPLKKRLRFFGSAVAIVAEVISALDRENKAKGRQVLPFNGRAPRPASVALREEHALAA